MAEATYGGFWIRSLAYAADLSILTLVLLALAVPFTFMGGAGIGLFSLLAAIGPIAYFVWFTASERQATFGKQLCGLKVQNAGSGAGITLLRSLGRELAKFVSAAVFFIGFLIVAFTGRKQGLHDVLASTVVARDGQPRIVVAILVALAGVVIPVIVIPLMFAGMFAGLMAMMMGGMLGEMEVKQTKPVPQMEQKVTQRQRPPAATNTVADLETVFRNYHKAVVAADLDEMLKWSVKSRRDAFATAPAAQRDDAMASTAKSMPKTYKVTGSIIEPNGSDATLYLSTDITDKGASDKPYGAAVMVKEEGAWKVAAAGWNREQSPAGMAASAAAPTAAPTAPAAKPAAASGADDPEAVYRNFHQAMLAADFKGMRNWGTKAKGDELAAMSAVEREMMIAFIAKLTPKTYRVLGTEISADGNTATVRLSAEQIVKGKTETYRGSGTLFKEAGEWKVDVSSWGGEQPPAPAPQSAPAKPAAAEPARPTVAEPPKPVAAPTPAARLAPAAPAAQPRSAPSRSEVAAPKPAAPTLQQSKPPCVYKPVMTDEDMARCR